jgi:hypothetical protein
VIEGPNSPGEGEPVNHATAEAVGGTSIQPSVSMPTFINLLVETLIAGITIFIGED